MVSQSLAVSLAMACALCATSATSEWPERSVLLPAVVASAETELGRDGEREQRAVLSVVSGDSNERDAGHAVLVAGLPESRDILRDALLQRRDRLLAGLRDAPGWAGLVSLATRKQRVRESQAQLRALVAELKAEWRSNETKDSRAWQRRWSSAARKLNQLHATTRQVDLTSTEQVKIADLAWTATKAHELDARHNSPGPAGWPAWLLVNDWGRSQFNLTDFVLDDLEREASDLLRTVRSDYTWRLSSGLTLRVLISEYRTHVDIGEACFYLGLCPPRWGGEMYDAVQRLADFRISAVPSVVGRLRAREADAERHIWKLVDDAKRLPATEVMSVRPLLHWFRIDSEIKVDSGSPGSWIVEHPHVARQLIQGDFTTCAAFGSLSPGFDVVLFREP